jgi:hypothetical protein
MRLQLYLDLIINISITCFAVKSEIIFDNFHSKIIFDIYNKCNVAGLHADENKIS